MSYSERGTTDPGMARLPGEYLYVAGSDLFNRLNQPSQHMPYHLAKHVERLDLVGYVRFYDGPPAPAWQRLRQGVQNVLAHRISISEKENTRTITARRLRLPGSLDPRIPCPMRLSPLPLHLYGRADQDHRDGSIPAG